MRLFSILFFLLNFSALAGDDYNTKIKPIFDNRCVACHSCNNSPCQLNLQSYEGFDRGASKAIVYDGLRTDSIMPTRMHIDANTTTEWREKGFFPVNNSKDLNDNILARVLAKKDPKKVEMPKIQVAESLVCADKVKYVTKETTMPYGFPSISFEEQKSVNKWLLAGAPGPEDKIIIDQKTLSQIRNWETFLNQKDLKHKLVSRYLYEHLFLAHIYFEKKPKYFFRLVRSKTSCEQGIVEIPTRRPNESPGKDTFQYCLKRLEGSFVTKTHITYPFTPDKMKSFEKIFFKPKWQVTEYPSYESTVAENPFVAFKDIPVKSRYQFLLDDAQYHLNTFIKGPVCNGSQAVNSIQEQFYVFFIDPDSDYMVNDPEYEKRVRTPLMLPGVWGSDIKLQKTTSLLKSIVDHRELYRKLRAGQMAKAQPQGPSLNNIWDGNKTNPNAFLTVFRHDDNAVVLKGPVGDLSKTVFMLDYPLMERLVYNLVVNFDVFGNIGHQLLTRVYMDLIRMEAEEMFLAFLPPKQRLPLRQDWYKGFFTEAKMDYVFPLIGKDLPTSVSFKNPKFAKQEMVEKVLYERLNSVTITGPDLINFKILESVVPPKRTHLDDQFHKIASLNSEIKYKFPQFFPEVIYLLIKTKKGNSKFYTVIRNREHENISWILSEELRLAPVEDTLTIREGYAANYPNLILDIDESQLDEMIQTILKISSKEDFANFAKTFAVSRTNPQFWSVYDELISLFKEQDPIEFGYLDLTRYSLEH